MSKKAGIRGKNKKKQEVHVYVCNRSFAFITAMLTALQVNKIKGYGRFLVVKLLSNRNLLPFMKNIDKIIKKYVVTKK